jgi:hypothetical protein
MARCSIPYGKCVSQAPKQRKFINHQALARAYSSLVTADHRATLVADRCLYLRVLGGTSSATMRGCRMKKWWTFPTLLLLLALAGCAHSQPAYEPPPPPPPPPPPAVEFREAADQGLHDGYQAAKSDVAAQRPPNVEEQEPFRNPPVPPEAVEAYRRAFRNGYEAFLHGAPPPPPPPPNR